MSALSFVVLGAQKSGTTTLFNLLKEHPRLWLPESKEARYFDRDDLAPHSEPELIRLYFRDAPAGAVLGKITPDYLPSTVVPLRLATACPEVRLAAILRDPLERARSHYRMMRRRSLERRTFAEAVVSDLGGTSESLDRLGGSRRYISDGLYGEHLTRYLQYFDRSSLVVVTTSDLEDDPAAVLATLHAHIGVESHLPERLGKHFHEGSAGQRVPGVYSRALRSSVARRAWHVMPLRYRDRIFWRFEQWNSSGHRRRPTDGVDTVPDDQLDEGLIADVTTRFQSDAVLLRSIVGRELSWTS